MITQNSQRLLQRTTEHAIRLLCTLALNFTVV